MEYKKENNIFAGVGMENLSAWRREVGRSMGAREMRKQRVGLAWPAETFVVRFHPPYDARSFFSQAQ